MTNINFPISPNVNDEYTFNGKTWMWNGTGWVILGSGADISGTGVVGQVAEFITNTKTLQAAKIIGPAANIITITNAAPATLALAISDGKTLTLTATDDFNLTVPASLTVAGLGIANVFTAGQTINVNSTTGLKVEQTGVKSDVLVVDTTNGAIGMGGDLTFSPSKGFIVQDTSGTRSMRISIAYNSAGSDGTYIGFTPSVTNQHAGFELYPSGTNTKSLLFMYGKGLPNSLTFMRFAISVGNYSDVYFSQSAAGTGYGVGNYVFTIPSAWKSFIIRAHADQIFNITEWQSSSGTILANIEPDGEFVLPQDSKAFWLGAGRDMSLYYDGTSGYIKTSDVAASDLHITTGAAKTVVLDTSVYDDLQFQVSNAKVTPNNLLPSWEVFTANTSEYAFAIDEEVDTQANELPHWWKEGTAGHAHLHITTKGVPAEEQKAQFTVTFAYADTNEVWVEAPLTAELTIPISTTALTNFYLDLGDLTLTNYLVGAQIRCRIKRVAKTAGGTEYAGDIYITQCGVHLEKTRMGSRAELTS